MPKIYLKAVRVNASLSQAELAEILGVSKNTVANWEAGKTEPNIKQLRKLSELSGIPLDFIYVPEQSNQIELMGHNNKKVG